MYSAATTRLVDAYERLLEQFTTSTTLAQFKQLFPASATHSRFSTRKVRITLKLNKDWDKETIAGLNKLVKNFGSHLHLDDVEFGCIEVTWLCTISVAQEIQQMIVTSKICSSLQSMGVTKILLFGKELWSVSLQSKQYH